MSIRYRPILGAQLDSFKVPGPLSIQWKEYDKGEGQYPTHGIPGLLPTYGTAGGESIHHLMEEGPRPDGLDAVPDRTVFETTTPWTIARFIQAQVAVWKRDNENRAAIVAEIAATPAIVTEADPSYTYVYKWTEAHEQQGETYSDPVDVAQLTYGHYITAYGDPTMCVTSCGISLTRQVESVTQLRREQAQIIRTELDEYPELVPKYIPTSTVYINGAAYVGQGEEDSTYSSTIIVEDTPGNLDPANYISAALSFIQTWKDWAQANHPSDTWYGPFYSTDTTTATPAGAADWGFTEPTIVRAKFYTVTYESVLWGQISATVAINYRYGDFIPLSEGYQDLDFTFASSFFRNGFRSKGARKKNTPFLTDSIQMRAPLSAYAPGSANAEEFKRKGIISIIELQEGNNVTPFECFIADCTGRELPLNDATGDVCGLPPDTEGYPDDWGYEWPTEPPVVIEAGEFILQDGSEEPLYPTMYGSFVYDTHLKKWGKFSGAFKQLLDYSPVNSPQNGLQSYARFGILGGIVDPNGAIRLFDTNPVRSVAVFGKFGYYRQGMTSPEEVRVHMRIPCTGSVQLNTSVEGKFYTLSLNQLQEFTSEIETTLYGGYSGRWHNVVVQGNYDISYLEFRGIIQGRR